MNFLTDQRNEHYCKFYVGQSADIARRVKVHKRNFDNHDDSTLHYYLVSLREGQPTCNFIRLFRLPAFDPDNDPVSPSHHRSLALSVLEMVIALAFRSLTTQGCEKYSPEGVTPARYQDIHLNVMIPLLQNSDITNVQRMQARQTLLSSDDPQVRSWPDYQGKTKAATVKIRTRLIPSFEDIRDAFNKSVMEAYPHFQVDKQGLMLNRPESPLPRIDMEAFLGEFSSGVLEGLHEDLPLETPFGRLMAHSTSSLHPLLSMSQVKMPARTKMDICHFGWIKQG